jgi:hypothetical protein
MTAEQRQRLLKLLEQADKSYGFSLDHSDPEIASTQACASCLMVLQLERIADVLEALANQSCKA